MHKLHNWNRLMSELVNWTLFVVTSIYQPTNANIISHKTFLKHFKTIRHVSILSDHHQGALFLAKVILQYSQFNSYLQMRCCGSISCCVGMCCGEPLLHNIPTQHDMLPQHLICKYELNCEYCNITLARKKALWWWSDKIETCRSVLKCFMWNYMCIRWLINWSDSTKMHGSTIRFIFLWSLNVELCYL